MPVQWSSGSPEPLTASLPKRSHADAHPGTAPRLMQDTSFKKTREELRSPQWLGIVLSIDSHELLENTGRCNIAIG